MASNTSLLKLTMTATQPTTTAVPTVSRFFNTAPTGGYTGNTTYTITAANWTDDDGNPVLANSLVPVTTNNGYTMLFINGQLQEGNVVTTLTAASLIITFSTATTIDEGKILSLVVTNFAPNTTAPIITG